MLLKKFTKFLISKSYQIFPDKAFKQILIPPGEELFSESQQKKKIAIIGVNVLDLMAARLNLSQDALSPKAREIFNNSKISYQNPFYNSLAQIIEIVHCLEESADILKSLTKRNLKEEKLPDYDKLKLTSGVGVMEAPRGTLYHAFEIDSGGFIKKANILTPTAQNFASLEDDLKLMVRKTDSLDQKRKKIQTLVRAYDPCVPCAVH